MEPPAVLEAAGASACDRCGDFAPLARVGARSLCAGCVAKRHPILAEPPSAGLYVAWSFKLIRTMGLPAGAMWAALFVLNGLASIAFQVGFGVSTQLTATSLVVTLLSMTLYMLVYTVGAGFQTALAIQAIDGPVDWRAAARLTLARLPALLGTSMLVGTGMFFGCMCCLVPGVVLSVIWSLPFPAILAHGVGPIAALSRSTRAVSDAWAPIGLAFTVTSLVWLAWSAVLSLPATGYMVFEMLESGPLAMTEAIHDPWFLAASLMANLFGGLSYIPLVNTAAIAYLNRTEGSNSGI